MAFSHGKDTKLYHGGYDLTTYFREASISPVGEAKETTTFGTSAKTYIPGVEDATVSASGLFDESANASGTVLHTALNVEGTELSVMLDGDTIGDFGYGLQGVQTKYDIMSPVDDVVSVAMEAQSTVGAERIVSLHALGAESANGTAVAVVDNAAATTGGAAGYIHFTTISGTPQWTVVIEHSSDNVTYAALATFTANATANTSERVEVAATTVNRYLRATWSKATGGGTAAFFVGASRTPNNN